VSYGAVIFHCPSCGTRLVECHAEADTVLFRSRSAWQRALLVSIRGRLVAEVTSATMSPEGFEVVGDGVMGKIALFDLYQVLNEHGRELLEI
jgi:hypothetical protein